MRETFQRLRQAGLDTAAITLLGFAIGCAIARVGADATPRSLQFTRTPEFAIWSIVVGFEVALRLNVFSALWGIRTEVRSRVGSGCLWASVAVVVIIAGMFRVAELMYPTIHSGLYCNWVRRMLLQLTMFVALGPGLVSIARIRLWIMRVSPKDPREQPRQLVVDVVYVNRTLQRILVLFSAVVVVSILDVAAFRIAFVAQTPKSTAFPIGLVILYGLLLTIVLSIIYLPVYSHFTEYKRRLCDSLCPIPANGIPDEEWQSTRDRTENLLQVPRRPWESLRSNYAILAPLVASVLSLFLPGLRF